MPDLIFSISLAVLRPRPKPLTSRTIVTYGIITLAGVIIHTLYRARYRYRL